MSVGCYDFDGARKLFPDLPVARFSPAWEELGKSLVMPQFILRKKNADPKDRYRTRLC